VPDVETSEFMHIFYKKLLNNQSVIDAFNSAQSEMKAKYRLDPFKWAAWVLVQ
jgi:CHAT domain-containing protein